MLRSILILLCALVLNAQAVHLQILTTTDTHGHVLPRDTYTLQPAQLGWAKLATLIRTLKAKNPNTLLVDCGDTLAGEPLNYVHNRLKPGLPEPSIAIMNALGYQAMAVGNHDYDFGFPLLRASEEQARFPFLSANTVFASTGKLAFTPYVKLEVAGVQVAILGLTYASVSMTADLSNVEGLRFLDPVETARTLVPRLRETEKADVVIVAIHGGLSNGPSSSLSGTPVQALAEKVPGIDLILAGHTHQPLAAKVAGVPVLQASYHGRALGVAELDLAKEKSKWKLESCELRLEQPSADTAQDPQVLESTAALQAETEAYLDTFATNLATDLDGRWGRMEDSAIAQLFHTVMRKATGAQLTAVFSPNPHFFVPKGPTSVRQFFALMPYEDRLATIRITGAQLRQYLEHAARAYNFSHQPELFNREMYPRDFDTIAGLDYALDLTKPLGSRVTQLVYRGAPVRDDQTFSLAITSYRLAGGGGYLAAMGFKGSADMVTTASLRNLLLEYVLSRPSLTIPLQNNWHTVPYLDRERVLAAQ